MGDHTVNLIAIALFGEFVAKLPDQVPDEIKSFGATCEKGPIDGIQAMVFAIGPHHRRCIVPRVRGHRDEPYPITHGRLIDHSLNLGDAFGMQGADIGTIGIDKIQHDDLAAQVRRRISAAGCIPQGEDRRLFVERLEVFLPFCGFALPNSSANGPGQAPRCSMPARRPGQWRLSFSWLKGVSLAFCRRARSCHDPATASVFECCSSSIALLRCSSQSSAASGPSCRFGLSFSPAFGVRRRHTQQLPRQFRQLGLPWPQFSFFEYSF